MNRKRIIFLTLLMISLLLTQVIGADSGLVIDHYQLHVNIDPASNVQMKGVLDSHMASRVAEFRLGHPIRWNDGRWIVFDGLKINPSSAFTIKSHQTGERFVLDYFVNYKQRMGAPFQMIHETNYKLGVDLHADKDDLKILIADDFWQATTNILSFSIALPHEIDAKQVSFETNRGNIADLLEYSVTGSVISGKTLTPIAPGDSIYLSLALPEGYFDQAKPLIFPGQTQAAVGPYLLSFALALSLALWFFLARNRKPITNLVPQVPLHLTAAEMGYLFDHSLDQSDTAALFFSWAQQGALKFIETKQSSIINPATFFSLEKTGTLSTQAKPYEQTMFEILFSRFGKDGLVTDSVLENRYYVHAEAGEKEIKEQVKLLNPFGVYEGYNKYLRIFILLLAWAAGYYTLILLSLDIYHLQGWILQVISIVVSGLLTMLVSLSTYFLSTYLVARDRTKLGLAALMLLTVGVAFGFLLFTTWKGKFFFSILFGLVSFFLLGFIAGNTNKRTKYGEDISENILGFRRFLTEVSEQELKQRVINQPNLFYDYLAFAFVLGVQRTWAKKFNNFAIEQPSWYQSNDPFLTRFNAYDFALRLEKTLERLTVVLFSAPAMGTKGSISPNMIEVKKIGNSWKIRY